MPNDNGTNILVNADEAVLMVEYNGQQGSLTSPVRWDSEPEDLKSIAAEAIRAGGVRGIDAQDPDFTDFVARPIPAKDGLPARWLISPKTPYAE